jgi:hypothetical protein
VGLEREALIAKQRFQHLPPQRQALLLEPGVKI